MITLRNFLQPFPKRIFETDAGLMSGDYDGSLDDKGFHHELVLWQSAKIGFVLFACSTRSTNQWPVLIEYHWVRRCCVLNCIGINTQLEVVLYSDTVVSVP